MQVNCQPAVAFSRFRRGGVIRQAGQYGFVGDPFSAKALVASSRFENLRPVATVLP